MIDVNIYFRKMLRACNKNNHEQLANDVSTKITRLLSVFCEEGDFICLFICYLPLHLITLVTPSIASLIV